MPEWIALSRTAHAEQGYRARDGYHHAAGRMVAPVVLAELHKILPHYVIGLLPQGDDLVPVALLGVNSEENLYLREDGGWQVSYVPATLRGHPFALADGQSGNKALAIDSAYLTAAGQPLFKNGELDETAAQAMRFLQQYDQSRRATRAACQALRQAGVLAEWPLAVPLGEGHRRINGLYRVDEAALNALSAEAYAKLQGMPMQLAYAQLYSVSQVAQLAHLAAQHETAGDATSSDLDGLFGEDDDELNFDFDSI